MIPPSFLLLASFFPPLSAITRRASRWPAAVRPRSRRRRARDGQAAGRAGAHPPRGLRVQSVRKFTSATRCGKRQRPPHRRRSTMAGPLATSAAVARESGRRTSSRRGRICTGWLIRRRCVSKHSLCSGADGAMQSSLSAEQRSLQPCVPALHACSPNVHRCAESGGSSTWGT